MKSRIARRNVTKNIKRLLGVAAAGATALLMKQQSASASPFTWTFAGNGSWALGTNWDTTPNPPATDGSADLVFNEVTGRTTINGDTTKTTTNYLLAVNSITFAAGTAANTLSPSVSTIALSIGTGGIINSSSATQTIGGTVAIGDGVTETWFSGSTATSKIVLSSVSALTIGTSSSLTINNTATASSVVLTGGFVLGSSSTLFQSGSGILSLAATSTIQSGANLNVDNGGSIVFGNNSLKSTGGNISIGAGTISVGGGTTLQSGSLTINGGTWLPGNAAVFSQSTLSVAAGTLNFGAGTNLVGSSIFIGSANSSSTIQFNSVTSYTPANWTIQSDAGSTISLVNTITGLVTMGGSYTVNNNFNVINSSTTSSPSTAFSGTWSASSSNSTLTFDGSGNTASSIVFNNSTSTFLGTVNVKSGILQFAYAAPPTTSPLLALGPANISLAGGTQLALVSGYYHGGQLPSNITLGAGVVTLNANIGGNTNQSLGGVISGVGQLKFIGAVNGNGNPGSGANITTLIGNNSYSGGTAYSAPAGVANGGASGGTGIELKATSANALGTGALTFVAPTISGAAIRTPNGVNNAGAINIGVINGYVDIEANQAIAGLSTSGSDIGTIRNDSNNTNSAVSITVNGSSSYVYSGSFVTSASKLSIIKSGAGTQALLGIQATNSNLALSIQSGNLQVSDQRNLGATSNVVTLDGGNLETNTGVAYGFTSPGALNLGSITAQQSVGVVSVGGAGVLPSAYAVGGITSVAVATGGGGYTSAPTATVDANIVRGVDTTATFNTTVSGTASSLSSATVASSGSYYYVPNLGTLSFTGSGGKTQGTVLITGMAVSAIGQSSTGFGVGNDATVTVTPQGGATATESAIITNPTIANPILLTSNGGGIQVDTYNGGASASTLSITGAITNTNSSAVLNKLGGGTLFLSNSTSSILGTFNIQGGTVSLSAAKTNIAFASASQIIVGNNVAASSSVFDVTGSTASYVFNSGQSVSGYGTLVGTSAVVSSGATLNPGTASTSGSLAVTGSLSVAGGANLLYNMGGSSTSTTTNVSSLFTLGASTASKVNLTVSNVGLGVYSLFTFGSYSGATGSAVNADFNVTGVPGIDTYSVVQSANDIELQVSGAPQIAEHVATNTSGRGNAGTIALQSNSAVNYYGRTDVNGGAGSTKGVITVDRSALGSPFTFNSPQIFLFQFESDSNSANNPTGFHYGGTAGVHGSPTTDGNQVADAAALSALEADLSSAGYTFVDYAGNNDPTATNTGGGGGTAANDATLAQALSLNTQYDLAIELEGPATGNPSYMDFDFSAYGAGGITTFNVAAVPEPASLSLVALSAMGLLGRRRSRKSRKAKMAAAGA